MIKLFKNREIGGKADSPPVIAWVVNETNVGKLLEIKITARKPI